MPSRSKVAVLYTQPETVLQDYQRLFELAGGVHALNPNTTTILKDNISWHYRDLCRDGRHHRWQRSRSAHHEAGG